jgi:hypothetical protein
MTLSEFSRDWVPVLQLVLTAVGLASLFLVWYQIRQTSRWNRLTTQYNFLNNDFNLSLDRSIVEPMIT